MSTFPTHSLHRCQDRQEVDSPARGDRRVGGVRGRGKPGIAAAQHAVDLLHLQRFKEARSVLRKMVPVARRVLGEHHETTLRLRWNYAMALSPDTGATLDDIREAVTTLEEIERTARRVLGGAHPLMLSIETNLRDAQAALRSRTG